MNQRRPYDAVKRILDLLGATFLLLLLWPLLLVVALLVRVKMGSPVVFTQQRLGRRNRVFSIQKFRTMNNRRDAAGGLLPDAERLTRTGAMLRKLSLDELPQIFNVLRGDMSFIGPRPLYIEYLPFYSKRESTRHWVRPGITGLAQVSGRNYLLWDQRLETDAIYVEKRSLGLDVRVLLGTVRQVFSSDDVSVIAAESGQRLDHERKLPGAAGIRLVPFDAEHISARVRAFQDERVYSTMNVPKNVSEESTLGWYQAIRRDPKRQDFTVLRADSEDVLGFVGIKEVTNHQYPELYILTVPKFQGQGVASKALGATLEWMDKNTWYPGCMLTVSPANMPAFGLYQRAGFCPVTEPGRPDKRIVMELRFVGRQNSHG